MAVNSTQEPKPAPEQETVRTRPAALPGMPLLALLSDLRTPRQSQFSLRGLNGSLHTTDQQGASI